MFRQFVKLICIALVVLILIEVALRLSSLFPGDTPFYRSDPVIGYRARAHVRIAENTTNSSGFNDIERSSAKSTNYKRVVFVGDSFVFGALPRTDNFVSLTEDLSRRAGAEVAMWNFGIPGAGPENYLGLIRKDVLSANADLVCLVFFIGNDIGQSHRDFKTRIWFGTPREILRSPYLMKPSIEYWYAYRLFRAGTKLLWHKLAQSQEKENGTFTKETYLSIEYERSAIYKIKQNIKEAESYEAAKAILQQMAVELAKNNTNFLVILAPDEIQVNSKLRDEVMKTYELDSNKYDFRQPQRLLLPYLRSRGIEVLDLLRDFAEAGATKSLYRKYDSHWNESGNQLAAQNIWTRIEAIMTPNR
ncbi:MAG: alginate O-acetyltransferase AlgX-related protein [Methylococcales bacterium]